MITNLRKVVIIVAVLNLAYFGVEFAVALAINSVSLFADSIDFLEDASVNFLIAIALGWSATSQARVGRNGSRRHPADTRHRYVLDGVGEVLGAVASCRASLVAGRCRCPGYQSVVRVHCWCISGHIAAA